MKRCSTCQETLDLTRFNRDKNSADGVGRQCKDCMRLYHAARRQANQAVIRQVKDRPCMDCGLRFPHFVMDLDHVRGKKLFDLSKAKHKRLELVIAEIAKCDVVCANCHRIRTHVNLKTQDK